ncbi:hypothetical protein HXX01_04765 [Candidatus Nomurabacteria bacterium]|nr:hypothetical protein [Candidatus Nomurabacteria bacterium]
MKKLVMFLIILLYITGIDAYCQNDDFEGGHMFPSFQKFKDEYPGNFGTTNKELFKNDFNPGSILVNERIPPCEGVAYAMLLVSHPQKMGLIKDGINIIQTTQGTIMICWGTKNQYKNEWCLFHLKYIIRSYDQKARVFTLKNKEPSH